MKTTKNLTIFILLIAVLSAFGFTHQKADWGSPEKGIIMQYHQPVGTVNKYKVTSSEGSEIDMGGQLVTGTGENDGEVVHTISKVSGGKITHELAFTSLSISNNHSMMGATSPPTAGLLNKPLILETGKMGDHVNPKNIADLPIAGEGFLPQAFGLMGIVPELASKPVKLNDKWTTKQTLPVTYQGNEIELTNEVVFTFTGMEKKMGLDCMKITGESKNVVKGSVNQQGTDLEMEITTTGKVTMYFAYKKGHIVEIESIDDGDITVDVPSAGMVLDGTANSKGKITFISTSSK